MMITSTANALEIFRLIVSGLGIITNVYGFLRARRASAEVLLSQNPSGRRVMMSASNIRNEILRCLIQCCIFAAAWSGANSPEAPGGLNANATLANLMWVCVAVLALAISVFDQHDRTHANLIDEVERRKLDDFEARRIARRREKEEHA